MKTSLSAALLVATCFGVAPAIAATLASPDFQASLSLDGSDFGPFSGVVGATADACDGIFGDTSACDLIVGADGDRPYFVVNWISDTSFDAAFDVSDGSLGKDETISFALTLLGLNYLIDGFAAPITSFAFNFADSDVDGFLKSEGNPDGTFFDNPTLTFTGSSVSAVITLSGQLEGDGARLRFNLSATPVAPPSSVPLPASGWMLGAGLMGLIAARRRPARISA